jgi:transposase
LEIEAFETYYNMTIAKINSVYIEKKEFYKSKTHCIISNCMNVRLENHSFLCHFHNKSKIDWGFKMTEKELRTELNVSNENISNLPDNHNLKKFLQVPYDLRAEGIRNALNSFSTCIKKYKKDKKAFILKEKDIGNIRRDKMAVFRSGMLKYTSKAILLNPTVYKKYCKDNKILEELPILNMHDIHFKLISNNNSFFQISKNKINKYYIHILIPSDHKIEQTKNKIISIDPGVRTFATGYDPSGTVIESYNDIIYNINMIHKKIDKTSSIIDKKDEFKIKSEKIYKLKKQNRKRHLKINNIVSDMHNQIASYLTKNYDNILYPPLETKQLIKKFKEDKNINTSSLENDDRATKKRKRIISSRTARLLSTLSFYKFLQKLKFQSNKNNCSLYIITEAFTSKTCGKCGFINKNLGSSKIYKCPSCKLEIGRDINGARNILLKHLE